MKGRACTQAPNGDFPSKPAPGRRGRPGAERTVMEGCPSPHPRNGRACTLPRSGDFQSNSTRRTGPSAVAKTNPILGRKSSACNEQRRGPARPRARPGPGPGPRAPQRTRRPDGHRNERTVLPRRRTPPEEKGAWAAGVEAGASPRSSDAHRPGARRLDPSHPRSTRRRDFPINPTRSTPSGPPIGRERTQAPTPRTNPTPPRPEKPGPDRGGSGERGGRCRWGASRAGRRGRAGGPPRRPRGGGSRAGEATDRGRRPGEAARDPSEAAGDPQRRRPQILERVEPGPQDADLGLRRALASREASSRAAASPAPGSAPPRPPRAGPRAPPRVRDRPPDRIPRGPPRRSAPPRRRGHPGARPAGTGRGRWPRASGRARGPARNGRSSGRRSRDGPGPRGAGDRPPAPSEATGTSATPS